MALIVRGITTLNAASSAEPYIVGILAAGAGMLLIAGLWTPFVGTLVAVIEVWNVFSLPQDPWTSILLGTLSAALVLLGPGAWSVDARIFGWKRIDLPERKR